MSADSFYDNLRSYLRLSVRVISKVGSDINVGEKFTLRLTGANVAYSAGIVQQPRIIFNNARICVEGTGYAKPTSGNGWHNLPDNKLYPGEASHVDIEFEALADISSWWTDFWNKEHVAKAWILADLDQNKFFEIWNYMNVHKEIEPT